MTTRRGRLLGRAADLAGAACAPALFHPSAAALTCGVDTEPGARCADATPPSSLLPARLASALALVLAGAFPAGAQSNCAPRGPVIVSLAETYGETVQSIGLAANGQVGEVWANLKTGTWTFTVTLPTGVICLIASGTAFEHAPAAPAPMGAPG